MKFWKNRKVILFLIIIFNSQLVYSQFDTLFWFAAPEVAIANLNFDRPIYLRITSSNNPSQVTISQPANPTFVPININIASLSTAQVDLTPWIEQIENKPANQILPYGIKITATQPVNAYYEIVSLQCNCNPEIFALKGRNALGTDFRIPMQNFFNNANHYTYLPVPYSAFDIVATQNNTSITITPTANIVGHLANIPFTITLNQGETYSATATSQIAASHLQGSKVTADKPIAITMKDDLIQNSTCADIAGDQLVPVNILGNKYIVVRGFLNSPYDKAFILATQNNTTVSINGVYITTLNDCQTYMYNMGTANAAYIETSAPVYVLHLSGFGCEVGMSILPQIECTGSSQITFTRSTNDPLQVTLLVKQGGESGFLLNGVAGVINSSSFTNVPGTSGQWKFAQISFPISQIPQGIASTISNTSQLFHLGIIHGTTNNGCRYGYFSDYGKYKYNITANGDHFCVGDTLILQANSIQGATYDWSGPNSFTSNGQNVQVFPITTNHQGTYIVNGTFGACLVEPDTIFIQVDSIVSVNLTANDTIFCEGDSLSIISNLNSTQGFFWNTPNGSFTGMDSLLINNLTTLDAGIYFVNGLNIICPVVSDSVYIQIQSPSTIQIVANDSIFCEGDTLNIHSTFIPDFQYHWNGPNGYSLATQNVILAPLTVLNSGLYVLNGTDGVCDVIPDSVVIIVNPSPMVNILPENPHICFGDSLNLFCMEGGAYFWSSGDTTNVIRISPNITTNYSVVITNDYDCEGSDQVTVFVHYPPMAEFTSIPDSTIIDYPDFVFHSNSNAYYWNWDFGDQNYSQSNPPVYHTYLQYDSSYWVTLIVGNEYHCYDTFSQYVVLYDVPLVFPNVFTPNNDGYNDYFEIINAEKIPNTYLVIYDRWGRIVYQKKNYTNDWNGEGYPAGTYYYVFKYRNKEYHSSLSILK